MNPGRNLDIIISGERGAYRLVAVRLDGTRLPDFPLKLEVGDAFQQLLMKRDAATTIAVGECLYNALATREIYGAFKACQAEGELRIRLSIRPPELAVTPWELLYDPQGRKFLVTTHERPLVRTLDTGETAQAAESDPLAGVAQALSAYRRLTRLSLRVLRPGGTLVQASCSSQVDGDSFFKTVNRATVEAGRPLQEIERSGHALDHPITFREGAYLKCLFAIAP